MLTRLARWWLNRKELAPPAPGVRSEDCETCGVPVSGPFLHTVISIAVDDEQLGIDGQTAMSADFCRAHCPGTCATMEDVSRADIIRHAYAEYHAKRITLAQLLRTIATWRPH